MVLPYYKTIYSSDMKTNLEIRRLLGKKICTLRKFRNLTQEQLGEISGINYKFLGQIERGNQNPSFNTLIRIASALDVELVELFDFESEIENREAIEKRVINIIKELKPKELLRVLIQLQLNYSTTTDKKTL